MPPSSVVLGESCGVAAVVVIMGGSRNGRIRERRGASPRRSLIEYVCEGEEENVCVGRKFVFKYP